MSRYHFAIAGIVALVLPLAGCHLYFTEDDEGDRLEEPKPDPCGREPDSALLRNPDDGTCEFHRDVNVGCNETCGSCEPVPRPDWGLCESSCTGLGEGTCMGTADCQAIYSDFPPQGTYVACWQISGVGSAPPLVQTCEGLNAYTCARLDTCTSLRTHDPGALSVFVDCRNEVDRVPPCEELVEESECVGRMDCT